MPRRYDVVGKCIYCGATTYKDGSSQPLGREHIVPMSLGGDLILPEASCSVCEDITKAIEGNLARGVFLPARTKLNFPTRRKKERPTHLPLEVGPEGEAQEISVAIADYPAMLLLFAFDPPGLLLGLPPSELFAGRVVMSKLPGFDQGLRKQGFDRTSWRLKADAEIVARVLAKIAHAYCIAELGLDGFKPFLLDLILGRQPMFPGHFVGGEFGAAEAPDGALYRLSHRIETLGYQQVVVVRIRLFANREGSPTYMVIAGKVADP